VRHHARTARGSADALLTLVRRGVAHSRPSPFPRVAALLRSIRDLFRHRAWATRTVRR
jgi:hypothetical protein